MIIQHSDTKDTSVQINNGVNIIFIIRILSNAVGSQLALTTSKATLKTARSQTVWLGKNARLDKFMPSTPSTQKDATPSTQKEASPIVEGLGRVLVYET